MADDVDMMQERLEKEEAIRRKYRDKSTNTIVATGWCLNCSAKLDSGLRFCDADCRDDWELMQKNRQG